VTDQDRLLSASRRPEDVDAALRPKSLDEFVGQQAARDNLRVFIQAAKGRGDALDHVLFFGPPGLGKTTLAQIIAREMGVGFRATSGPVIAKSGDLAALLTNLEDGDVLFIDEIHRLQPAVEEVLYPAMEDRALDLMIGEGRRRARCGSTCRASRWSGDDAPGAADHALARSLRHPGPPAILYGRRAGARVVTRAARLLDLPIAEDGAVEVARRSRGTPRVAGRLLRRVRDFATVAGHEIVHAAAADQALNRLEVDSLGLDAMDRRYLTMIADVYRGGPVGVETLAAGLSEPRDTIEEVIEPYLIQLGLLARTARGRILNAGGGSIWAEPAGGVAGRVVRRLRGGRAFRKGPPPVGRPAGARQGITRLDPRSAGPSGSVVAILHDRQAIRRSRAAAIQRSLAASVSLIPSNRWKTRRIVLCG
jgi:Holliday junction DNA helicase RuvB